MLFRSKTGRTCQALERKQTTSTWLDCSRLMSDFSVRSREFIKACFCRKTHRLLPLYVLGNRSKTLLLLIICKRTDSPTASRLRSEGTSLKSHRLNIYNGIVPSNANIPEPIREPPAPITRSFNTFSDFFIRPSSSFLAKASIVFWIILFTFSVLSPNVC